MVKHLVLIWRNGQHNWQIIAIGVGASLVLCAGLMAARPDPADTELPSSPRPGTYARGTETVDAIIKAALRVLIDEGSGAFTIRRIAAECGMKVGNVSYHFPKKELLIQTLLDDIIGSYDKLLERTVRQPGLDAEERLRLIVVMCLDDIAGKRTTRLFPELWALANHNEFVADRVRVFYQRVHDFISDYVAQLNPALSHQEVRDVALFISASMEGATPFLGYEKPWAARMPAFTAIAAHGLVHIAKTITSAQIAGLDARQ
ncbi:TetR family transcriptional regulator C-terminal domain-containing protein [Novosphingobium sp. 17-62-19]|uniref:TetR/AcrR family transcriptional regulator n=1 Tax=Novosphingobium sp. 17-62-19 TaxID=1970406 RepID=UPI0025D42F46|nr:TetR family transcriptional regulator C-terminal domain-containing protein [Novosphingobium sp. 17-62-19]HQS96549.1 TetR family transcriptional regulator C-terminal domain-containing protein [Novosphingobium sp.]